MPRVLTVLAALLVSFATAAQQSGANRENAAVETGPVYEIELIVFRHSGSARDWTLVDALRDFRELPAAARAREPDADNGSSPAMETVWRRFKNSSAYQPLQYLHWRSVAGSYEHPGRWRVHGPQPLPAGQRELSGNIVPEPFAAGPPMSLLRRQVYSPLRPGPGLHYGLDGMFSLAAEPGLTAGLEIVHRRLIGASSQQGNTGATAEPVVEYQQINQRRRIETGRLEYFDTPALAALLQIREVELTSKPPPAPVPETAGETGFTSTRRKSVDREQGDDGS